jgi:hypothetical protein
MQMQMSPRHSTHGEVKSASPQPCTQRHVRTVQLMCRRYARKGLSVSLSHAPSTPLQANTARQTQQGKHSKAGRRDHHKQGKQGAGNGRRPGVRKQGKQGSKQAGRPASLRHSAVLSTRRAARDA